ncbi:RraA family protein [Enterovirga rhinocerotis]|uniref:Putative 4-hydroxy-4-methyl-2-oxoglutarate aldolase n=1 Tax=Enterovirga rhinocerotis TaxID=1339210 RepID=A0A4R7CAE5_9HYPH|nr:RraA family protein [Enterovirga rhinocerotis]TDR95688.1 RraA family protein [Enterovirga rhinocerotis]
MIGFRIEPRLAAIDPALLGTLGGIPTPIVSDNMGRLYAGGASLRSFHDGSAMIGSALTVRTRPGDNLMVHKAIDMAEPGDVIVVDAGGDMTNAIIGEIMLNIAASRGVAGFVIDGCIRDSDAIARASLPVFARGASHRGPYKDGPGEINVPVTVGGQPVMPGDIMLGDVDGVLAVPRSQAAAVAELAQAQLKREEAILASIADGTVDRSWVDATLRAKGLPL